MLGKDCAVNVNPFLTLPPFPHIEVSLSRSFCGALALSNAGDMIIYLSTHIRILRLFICQALL